MPGSNERGLYDDLRRRWSSSGWLDAVCARAEARLRDHPHGDLPAWTAALEALPALQPAAGLDRDPLELGRPAADPDALRAALMRLHPWRKGPLRLGGIDIDTEWRSDWKWRRVAPHVDLRGQRVLDIGCGNGYYGWRMLGAGADLVVGIDPTVLFVMQWRACRRCAGDLGNFVLPLAVEELPPDGGGFDSVFSMGVLYHRKDPLEHLRQLRGFLRPGGSLVLETLVLPSDRARDLLQPAGRYARMPNVHAIPGTDRLLDWLRGSGFDGARIADVTRTTVAEQRRTEWMQFESLAESLDPADPGRTVEGYPAPVRAIAVASAG